MPLVQDRYNTTDDIIKYKESVCIFLKNKELYVKWKYFKLFY